MKVLVSGGGTGGHIYPAVSLVKYIQQKHPDAEFLYVGTKKGLESKIVPDQGIPFETIEIQGFKRSLSSQITRFCGILKENNINVTIRREFGSKVSAACGQLRSKIEEENK